MENSTRSLPPLEGGAVKTPHPWECSGFASCLSAGLGRGEPFRAGEAGPQKPCFHQWGVEWGGF